MNNSLKSWFGQVTTGHGFMILAPTVLSVMSGTMNWTAAAPLLVAGALGLAWPENTALQAAGQTVASALADAVTAFVNRPGSVPTSKPPV